jgi:H+/Cl- antiporter ClcA
MADGQPGMASPPAAKAVPAPTGDPLAIIRTPAYLWLLLLAAVTGPPVAVIAYGFLALVDRLGHWLYTGLPAGLGFGTTPVWWPLPMLAVGGVLVGLAIRYLPGGGGHSPAEGFRVGGLVPAVQLPGIAVAAIASLSIGAVVGPEAPLILIGSGLGALAMRLFRRDAPATSQAIMAGTGSVAAISTLLGSPLLAAILLLEVAGIGGPAAAVVLLPGLLAAGIGALVFIGLGSFTGLGTLSLALPNLPPFAHPTLAMFAWAVAFGVAASLLGVAIRRLALLVRLYVSRRLLLLTPAAGLGVAVLSIVFAQLSGKSSSIVLFSGEAALGPLIEHAAGWSAATLLLLVVMKGLAYGLSLGSFRGGPIFPAMFLGAAAGIAASHLPGLVLVPALAMGIGTMCAAMLRFPITSVLLATLLLGTDGLAVMPLVIVGVVVAFVAVERLDGLLPGRPA